VSEKAVSRSEEIATQIDGLAEFVAEQPIVGGAWKGTWVQSPNLRALEGRRGSGSQAGLIGFGFFPAGVYPACSKHGAMNCVKPASEDEGSFWRCLAEGCNIGAALVGEGPS
jgi:hypothetical protein